MVDSEIVASDFERQQSANARLYLLDCDYRSEPHDSSLMDMSPATNGTASRGVLF
ncbi:MAG: hypothetical protein ACLQVD_08850 [Capsulimonadaceae bacterium]